MNHPAQGPAVIVRRSACSWMTTKWCAAGSGTCLMRNPTSRSSGGRDGRIGANRDLVLPPDVGLARCPASGRRSRAVCREYVRAARHGMPDAHGVRDDQAVMAPSWRERQVTSSKQASGRELVGPVARRGGRVDPRPDAAQRVMRQRPDGPRAEVRCGPVRTGKAGPGLIGKA